MLYEIVTAPPSERTSVPFPQRIELATTGLHWKLNIPPPVDALFLVKVALTTMELLLSLSSAPPLDDALFE